MTEEAKVEVSEAVESHDVELDVVEKAIDEVAAQNKAVVDENAELKQFAEEAKKEIESLRADVDTYNAKSRAPSFISSEKKEDPKMEAKEQFGLFLKEGLDGLKRKGTDMQISTDAQGGYALPEELRQRIIEIQYEESPMRQVCSAATASTTDVRQLVGIGAAASGWVGETDTRAQTNAPELAERVATFGEIYAKPRIYQHMLEDAFYDVVDHVTREVGRQFREQSDQAFLNGDGVNKPKGILNGLTLASGSAAASDTNGTFQVIDTGANNSLGATTADILGLMRSVVLSMRTPYLPGAKWMMNRNTHNALVELSNGDTEFYLQRDITEAAATRLLGYEIVINDQMDDIDLAAASAPIMFGDFARGFQIVDRVGVSVLQDPYSAHGSMLYYTRARVGSMNLDAQAVKVVSVQHV